MAEASREDLMALIEWLSHTVMKYHDLRHEAIALPPDECKETVMMEFPVIQGSKLQQKLREIGDRALGHDFDQEALRRALETVLIETKEPLTVDPKDTISITVKGEFLGPRRMTLRSPVMMELGQTINRFDSSTLDLGKITKWKVISRHFTPSGDIDYYIAEEVL